MTRTVKSPAIRKRRGKRSESTEANFGEDLNFKREWLTRWDIHGHTEPNGFVALPFRADGLPGRPLVQVLVSAQDFEQLCSEWMAPTVSGLVLDMTYPHIPNLSASRKVRDGR